MPVGTDKYGYDINEGDYCRFKFNKKSYIGKIDYCEDDYAYCFDLDKEVDTIISLYMHKAEIGTIELLVECAECHSYCLDDDQYFCTTCEGSKLMTFEDYVKGASK